MLLGPSSLKLLNECSYNLDWLINKKDINIKTKYVSIYKYDIVKKTQDETLFIIMKNNFPLF